MSVIIQTPTVQNESDKRLPCHLSFYESPPRRSPKYGGDRRNPSLLASQLQQHGARARDWLRAASDVVGLQRFRKKYFLRRKIFLAEKKYISCGEKFISCGKIYFLRKKNSCGKKYFLRKKIYFLRRKIYFLRKNIFLAEKIYFLRKKYISCGKKYFLRKKKYFLRKNIFCTMLPISFRRSLEDAAMDFFDHLRSLGFSEEEIGKMRDDFIFSAIHKKTRDKVDIPNVRWPWRDITT